MKVLLICGSIARHSHTRALLRSIEQCLVELGVESRLWDLRVDPLPITDPAYHHAPETNPDAVVREFVEQVRYADAFVLGSPLYHGSYSGVLKNALDQLWYDAFRNKAVGLVSHGSGTRTCTQPSEDLRSVVRTLYGYSTQTQVATTNTDYRRYEDGYELEDPDIQDRVRRLALELVQLTVLFRKTDIIKED